MLKKRSRVSLKVGWFGRQLWRCISINSGGWETHWLLLVLLVVVVLLQWRGVMLLGGQLRRDVLFKSCCLHQSADCCGV